MIAIEPNTVLQSNLWPDRVRVSTVRLLRAYTKNEAVGIQTQQYYYRILTEMDMTVTTGSQYDFREKG